MANYSDTYGGGTYKPMDAEERQRRIAKQKQRDMQAREAEKQRGVNNSTDIAYRYGTGTSGYLQMADKGHLTEAQNNQWSQNLLADQLSKANKSYSVQNTPSMKQAIGQSAGMRRERAQEQRSTEDMLKGVSGPDSSIPSLNNMRSGRGTPSVESQYGAQSYGSAADNYLQDYYEKINKGESIDGNEFMGTRITYGNEDQLKQIRDEMMLLEKMNMPKRDKERAMQRLNKKYENVRAQGVPQETPEYKKWKEQQTIAAQKLYGEATRNLSEDQYSVGNQEITQENINPFAMNQPTQPEQTQAVMPGTTGIGQPTTNVGSMSEPMQGGQGLMPSGISSGGQMDMGEQINPYTGEPVSGGMGMVGGGQGGYMGQYAQNVNNVLSSQLATAKESMDMGMSLAQSEYEAKNQGLRNKILLGLQNSNALAKMRSRGYDPDTMTTQEIINFLSQEGVDISESDRQLIQARGASAVDSLMAAKNDDFARLDVERSKMEREFNRALYETEQMNMANDNAVKKMVALFGGGKVESLATNMEIVRATERGQMMKNDLLGQYADNKTLLAIEANKMSRFYTENINNIQMEMASMENDMRTQLIDKLDGFIDQNITNEADLMKAMKPEIQNFLKTQGELKMKAFEMINEENARFEDMQLKIREQQRQEDKFMSEQYGFLFKDGQPVVDANGFQVPTMDNMKFQNQLDQQLTEQTGYLYQNGQQVLDGRGNPIQTFGREKFLTQEARYAQEFAADQYWKQANYNQDVAQFNANYNLQVEKFMQEGARYDEAQRLAKDQLMLEMREKGYTPVTDVPGFKGGMQETVANLENTNYGIMQSPDGGIRIDIDENSELPDQRWDGRKLDKSAYQCGEFVNDVFGTGMMGDTVGDKLKKVVTDMPTIGSAFVQRTQGEYGHTGIVENVQMGPDGRPVSMTIVDANARNSGKIRRSQVNISYDENGNPTYMREGDAGGKMLIEGYTSPLTGQPSASMLPRDNSNYVSIGGQIYQSPTGAIGGDQDIPLGELNQYQGASYDFAQRMEQAEKIMRETIPMINEGDLMQRGTENTFLIGGVLGAAKSSQMKRQEQAERSFVNAVLRKESGASISPEEFASARRQYFPMLGDTPETLRQKEQNRKLVIENMYKLGGQYSKANNFTQTIGGETNQLTGGMGATASGFVNKQAANVYQQSVPIGYTPVIDRNTGQVVVLAPGEYNDPNLYKSL